jgi:hypothetical protein
MAANHFNCVRVSKKEEADITILFAEAEEEEVFVPKKRNFLAYFMQ